MNAGKTKWLEELEVKIKENCFVTPSSHLNTKALIEFIAQTIEEETKKAIAMKKEEFDKKFEGYWRGEAIPDEIKFFLKKAIRESVEEALREVRPPKLLINSGSVRDELTIYFDSRVNEFMKRIRKLFSRR